MTTEFNSNLNINHMQQVQNTQSAQEAKPAFGAEVQAENAVQSTDVPRGQEAVAGRSQIKTDNIKSDMIAFMANPKAIEVSDKLFDIAYADLTAKNDPEAYEKACLLTSQFINEYSKK